MIERLRLESIAQIFGLIGRPPPPHPLVCVIAASWQPPLRISIPVVGRPIESSLYVLSLKRGDECHSEFGRQTHDGQAGSIVFASPGQTITPLGGQNEEYEGDGWTVVFHPDLLHKTTLGAAMPRYRFFGYAAREALHLTESERESFTTIVKQLEAEASVPPDLFAPDVLTAQLQLLLTYCQRAYARQFEARARTGGAVAERLAQHLDAHFASPAQALPTVRSCARALGYSPDYLSDLLRSQTGTNTRGHIHRALIEAAKSRLLASSANASEVAHALGFEHAQHFSKLFKLKTGQSPGEWRRQAASGSTQRRLKP
jgi:AraC family transcriptional activator of pobA